MVHPSINPIIFFSFIFSATRKFSGNTPNLSRNCSGVAASAFGNEDGVLGALKQ